VGRKKCLELSGQWERHLGGTGDDRDEKTYQYPLVIFKIKPGRFDSGKVDKLWGTVGVADS
jgi:hypothetical protein